MFYRANFIWSNTTINSVKLSCFAILLALIHLKSNKNYRPSSFINEPIHQNQHC